MAHVHSIYRYPVKGLSAQPLARVEIAAGKPLPWDRIFALARPTAPIDRNDPQWAKKGLFAMLMLDEGLAQVTTHLDLDTLSLTARRGDRQVAAGCLADAADRQELERFFWSLLPNFTAPPVILRSRGGHFMDKPDNVISLVNLATLRTLEAKWGVTIEALRFRANIYVDGAEPREEFDWIGREIRIGGTLFAVDRKNGRCGATNVNPDTGRRDLDIPTALRASFGHKNLGIYLVARQNGSVSVGDALALPGSVAARGAEEAGSSRAAGAGPRFICAGCYFVYDETVGLPDQGIAPGTIFGTFLAEWRCPDCGTEKSIFRPHAAVA